MVKELNNRRLQAEEAERRVQQEREETEREHERMMGRMKYEQEEREKIVGEILFFHIFH